MDLELIRLNMVTTITRSCEQNNTLTRYDYFFVTNLAADQYQVDQVEGAVLNFLEGVLETVGDSDLNKPYWDQLQLICDDTMQKWCFRVSMYGLQLNRHCKLEL